MGYPSLLGDHVDSVATLTMSRPEARNALDIRMREELVEALDEIERDPAMRVVILTGAGGHFSAGGDVKTMAVRRHTASEGRERVELLNRFVLRLFNFPKPTIAMVDGFANPSTMAMVGLGKLKRRSTKRFKSSTRSRPSEAVWRRTAMVFTSPPAEKWPPAPVRMTTRMAGSRSISSSASTSSSRIRMSRAFRASGRLMVRVATLST